MPDTLVAPTRGGFLGHFFRRVLHFSMAAVPVFYYFYGSEIQHLALLSRESWVVVILFLCFILEIIRLRSGWTLFGQRAREAKQISSFAWGVFSLAMVLLFAPGAQFATAIIWSCALVDPVLGELRRFNVKKRWVFFWGMLLVILVWLVSSAWISDALRLLSIPIWWSCLMGPVTVIAEWLNSKWIDDNALMQLVPLGLVLFIMQ